MENITIFRKIIYFKWRARRLLIAAVLLLSIAVGRTVSSAPPEVTAIQATWLYGTVAIAPSVTKTGYNYQYTGTPLKGDARLEKVETDLKRSASAPAVIYLHGCDGPASSRPVFGIFQLAGYTVFAPDSFARPGRSVLCGAGGMEYRVSMRHEEVEYALSQIRNFPWVDQDSLVLAGFSEGSQAVAAWQGQEFGTHLLIGTDCRHNGGTPSAGDGIVVFNLVGTEDHWGYGGGCRLTGSQLSSGSMVKLYPGLEHNILPVSEVQNDLLAFLKSVGPEFLERRRQEREKLRQANLNGTWNGIRECRGLASRKFKAVVRNGNFKVNLGGKLMEQLLGVISPEGKIRITDSYVDKGKTDTMTFIGQLPIVGGDDGVRKAILALDGDFEGCQIVLTNR